MKKILIIILSPLLLFCSCKNKLADVYKKFGTGQNKERQQLHLVPVDSSLQCNEDISAEDRRFIFLHKKETELAAPAYLRKIILLDASKQTIATEEDHFKNPLQKKYLITSHDYTTSTTTIVLQDIPGTTSVTLDNMQADSILKNWEISDNPFSTTLH
ncbi:hypothetical protein [Ferruginibacter sp.]